MRILGPSMPGSVPPRVFAGCERALRLTGQLPEVRRIVGGLAQGGLPLKSLLH